MGRSTFVAAVLSLFLWCPIRAAESVHFEDLRLKAAVEQELRMPDPTPEDMLALTSLAVEAQGITDLTGLEYAANLEQLWIRWNRISDLSPLSGLTSLTLLDAHGNDVISDVSPLSGLVHLETLILRYNCISDISALSGLTNLVHLHLEWNRIADLSALADLTNLNEISLQYNRFSDISSLVGLTSLASLDIRGNPLNAEACSTYIPEIIANNPGIDLERNSCKQHRVVFSSTQGGYICSPGEGEFLYDNGAVVYLQAEADDGYVFTGFTGTYNTLENPTLVTMEQDHEILANFVRAQGDSGDGGSDGGGNAAVIHVDDDARNDPGPGSSKISDRLENGTAEHPFDRIQEGIDAAKDGATIFVHAGTYCERIDLLGKRITVTGFDPADANIPQWPVIDGGGMGPVVFFSPATSVDCAMAGFVITNGRDGLAAAIRCSAASPTISNCVIAGHRASSPDAAVVYCEDSNAVFVNCTMADNQAGEQAAALYVRNGRVTVRNSILWDDGPREVFCGDVGEIAIDHSDIREDWPGPGNLRLDPLFAASGSWVNGENPDVGVGPDDPGATWIMGDYHLRSQGGRWDSRAHRWVRDGVTSPCIDAGDPGSPVGREMYPNGNTIDMGAYGGTVEASRSVGDTGDSNVE